MSYGHEAEGSHDDLHDDGFHRDVHDGDGLQRRTAIEKSELSEKNNSVARRNLRNLSGFKMVPTQHLAEHDGFTK
jgi:hypothetical protein